MRTETKLLNMGKQSLSIQLCKIKKQLMKIFVIFLLLPYGNIFSQNQSDTDSLYEILDFQLEEAYDKQNWKEVARLQKSVYLYDKNTTHLFRAAIAYARLNDTVAALNTLDSAVAEGYTNIYTLDGDPILSFLRTEKQWIEMRQRAQEKYQEKEDIFYWGLYYGILSIILILNVVLFISTKEISYLLLSLMLFADMHWEMFENSSLKAYFVKVIPWMAEVLASRSIPSAFFIGLLVVSYLFFSKVFLKLKEKIPRFNIIYNLLIASFFLFITDSIFDWNFIPGFLQPIFILSAFVAPLIAGVFLWRKGFSDAKYFTFTNLVFVFCLFIHVFSSKAPIVFVYTSFNIGLLLFFILLTLGVGGKMRSMRREKEMAQEKALVVLEQKVQERTVEVMQQKHLVEEKQKEIVDSISYAKRLQDAILPPLEFLNTHLKNSFVYYQPKDIVAGDFYWAEKVGEKFFIAAADSTGHGVPGAMVSVVCSNALNRTIKEFKLTETGKILDKTRDLVLETFEKSASEVKDGMDISLLCIDSKNKNIFWSGANNPLWYIQDNELKEIKADKQPIGKSDYPKPFTTHQIEYKESTTFYLFTDGFADQFGGPNGKKFKYKQFSDLLVKNNNLSQNQQADIINKAFSDWKGDLEQVDDVCVIGIKL